MNQDCGQEDDSMQPAEPCLHRRRWMARLGALGVACVVPSRIEAALKPSAAPALLLARDMPARLDPSPYLVSEKLDGVRAVWDGQRLRFRSGQPVSAPAWFTQRLPSRPLDGELWLARGRFEQLSGIVRREQPVDAEWRQLSYCLFELPDADGPFEDRARVLSDVARSTGWQQIKAVDQSRVADAPTLRRRFQAVLRQGGEGLMLHRADAPYVTGRSDVLFKLKPWLDAEAEVLAHLPGRGRHAGRLGALRVRSLDSDEHHDDESAVAAGREFSIGTGLSDAQREAPPPPGSVVSYRYRGLTALGLPRHPSFLRLRGDL